MAVELVQKDVPIPCSKCGNQTSDIYQAKAKDGGMWSGQTLTVCICSKCGESTMLPTPNETLKETSQNTTTVTCPYCSSTNCKKITGASKVGKVLMWGVLAAGSVGHTWHCNSCGSNFG